MRRVDAHHHVWDLAVRAQGWMTSDAYAPIARTFGIDDFTTAAATARVDASVVVQTVSDRAETIELLHLAAHHRVVAAVVGWVDLCAADVRDQLDECLGAEGGAFLRGIRHQVHDEPDPQWVCGRDVQRGIAAVGAAGLVYELLIKPQHLEAALLTVSALPEVRFVIDHAAKPSVATGELEPWLSGLRALARRPNTVCKLSGLLHEADWQHWTANDIDPYAEAVIEAFGVERVMVGSDWPVCLLAAPYAAALTVYDDALPALGAHDRHALHATTAMAVYSIPDRPEASVT